MSRAGACNAAWLADQSRLRIQQLCSSSNGLCRQCRQPIVQAATVKQLSVHDGRQAQLVEARQKVARAVGITPQQQILMESKEKAMLFNFTAGAFVMEVA